MRERLGRVHSNDPIPYTDGGAIAVGGDYCPYPINPATFPVTFTETGLTSGSWSVALANDTESALAGGRSPSPSRSERGDSPSAPLPGSRSRRAREPSRWPGAAQNVAITFTEPVPPPPPLKYTVTFTETGLPFGSWSVAFGNETASTLAGAPVFFSVVAGTYSYSVLAEPGFTVSPSSGSVTVPGVVTSVSVTFSVPPKPAPLYPVTFSESGLALGTIWTVTVNSETESSYGPILSFSEANGTYTYQVGAVPDYASPSSGSVTVDGASAFVGLAFVPSNGYLNVTVTVSNATVLVSGNVQNGNVPLAPSGVYSVSLPPGTYTVTVTKSGYSPYTDTVLVAPGKTTSLTVTLVAQPSTSGAALSNVQYRRADRGDPNTRARRRRGGTARPEATEIARGESPGLGREQGR